MPQHWMQYDVFNQMKVQLVTQAEPLFCTSLIHKKLVKDKMAKNCHLFLL